MDKIIIVKHWKVSAWLGKLSLRNLLWFSEGLAEHLVKGFVNLVCLDFQ